MKLKIYYSKSCSSDLVFNNKKVWEDKFDFSDLENGHQK